MDKKKPEAKESFEKNYVLESPLDLASRKEGIEKKAEITESEEIKKARQKIEGAGLSPDQQADLKVQADKLNALKLEDDGKIKKLFDFAKTKGVVFAVGVAKKMEDPYILDKLHDKLAENGFYKDFLKK